MAYTRPTLSHIRALKSFPRHDYVFRDSTAVEMGVPARNPAQLQDNVDLELQSAAVQPQEMKKVVLGSPICGWYLLV